MNYWGKLWLFLIAMWTSAAAVFLSKISDTLVLILEKM